MPFCVQVCFVFTAVFVYRVVFAVCKSQRFLFRLRPDVFSMRNFWVSLVFIQFVTVSVFRVVTTDYKHQRFLFCLSLYLFSEWHIVPQLYIQIKQSRVHSRKALYGWKASRRLGKQIRCFYRFLSKAHPAAPYNIQGSYKSLSSVFRLRLIEAITLPFHLQKSKYSLSISLSPRSIFCNNRLLRNFLLSPSTLYGPTL